MSNLYLSFSVVFPLFCMMALGYVLRIVRIFNEDFLRQLNNLCFKAFLPAILFINIYNSDFSGAFSAKLIIFAIVSVLVCFFGLMLTVPRLCHDSKKCGVIIQGVFRSNYILFGIPVTAAIFGEKNVAVTAILIAFIVPIFNILSVIALEWFSEKRTDPLKMAIKVLKNPLIITSLIAFLFIITGIRLPALVEKTVSDISKIATPLALIALGGSFQFKNLGHARAALFGSVLGKLAILPLIFIPLGIAFGFRNLELGALLAMFASPTAVSSYTMVQSMEGDDILAGQIVVCTSIASILSMFLWIMGLKQLGFM